MVAVGTRAQYGHTGGALTLFDVSTHKLERYDAIAPDQGVTALTADSERIYAGTEIKADGVPPVAKEAQIFAFDIRTRKVLWRWRPFPGLAQYTDLLVHGHTLYGLTDSRKLFVADLRNRTIQRSYSVAGGTGQLVLRRGVVYGATTSQVFRLDPTGPVTVLDGLAGYWYNEPQLALDPSTDDLFTVKGTHLVRIEP
jgi:outer membrane protein assembly factor BamB